MEIISAIWYHESNPTLAIVGNNSFIIKIVPTSLISTSFHYQMSLKKNTAF